MTGSRWHEYGIGVDEDVRQRQQRNLAALLDGYAPSTPQRRVLADAIGKQMTRRALDLEDMARTDPAFSLLATATTHEQHATTPSGGPTPASTYPHGPI